MDNNYDYSEFEQEAPKKDVSKYDYSEFADQKDSGEVDTFLGKMPSPKKAEELFSSPESVNTMLGEAIGGPGMAIEGMANPYAIGMVTKGIGKGYKALKNVVTGAFKDLSPAEQAVEKASAAHEALTTGEIAAPEKEALSKAEENIKNHLDVGSVHKVEAASRIAQRAESIEKYWGNAYTKFKEKIKNLNVSMPEKVSREYGANRDAIIKAAQEGRLADVRAGKVTMEESKNPYLNRILMMSPKPETINASELLDQLQDFKSSRYDLMQDMKEAPTRLERNQIKEALDESSKIEAAANKALRNGLGEHASELDWLNKGYSEQVHPLRANPVIRAAKKGKLSDNMVNSLSTNESGMPLVREMIKQDPELLRKVVGQRYARNPQEILNPHAGMREYLNEMPELQNLVKQHEGSLAKLEEATKNHAANKGLSLKEKVNAERELKKLLATRKKNRVLLGSGASLVTPPTLYWLGKAITQGNNSQGG